MEAANVKGRRRLVKTRSQREKDPERTETRSADRSPRDKTRSRSRSRSGENPRGRLEFTVGGESAYRGSSPSESQLIIAAQEAREATAAAPEREIPDLDIGPVKAASALPPLVIVFIAMLVILCLMWV